MTKMARLTVEDGLLIKALRIEKGWSFDRMIAEFPARQWKFVQFFSGPPCSYENMAIRVFPTDRQTDKPINQGSDTQVRTQKTWWVFLGTPTLKKSTAKKPTFYFNLILVYTLNATNNAFLLL